MTWSAGFVRPFPKLEADSAIDALESSSPPEPAALDQLRMAKIAAKMLLANIAGPYVMVRLNGHANGVGWQSKKGWSSDSISVTVTQVTDEFYP